ncbi:hypothetical protein Ahu01nite_074640 [Winogradskya humida]|uniref:Uncharacterized protein n=1 Tax=Winogradskya humida TaxID=113566 RepID=A0ABQ4A0K3_9ACTN|nr:hypothetical protein Ahu01nite_074640 [Actinoplanes humidus]
MAGTAIADITQNDGNNLRNRRSTASGPDLSIEAAISEPAIANITDIAGRAMVSAAQPVQW